MEALADTFQVEAVEMGPMIDFWLRCQVLNFVNGKKKEGRIYMVQSFDLKGTYMTNLMSEAPAKGTVDSAINWLKEKTA